MIKKLNVIMVFCLPITVLADGFVQYPVSYHCPAANQVAIQRDGTFEATTYINGLSVQWQGKAVHSEVGVRAAKFKKAVLACDNNAQTCMIFCDYIATGNNNVIRLTISEMNVAFHKAMAGGYGEYWKNNQCIRNQNKDCVFQLVEGY
ncbi:DUF3757 domain-containing protein [Thiotrichales bacterium 19S3-7]|nr:DUF3757 domain-containing protein [Thiotrichales bacterium 19S3-7]MCF6801014.1 DUF3757 domain-containing protein [Thiotrichales bacterium 19S3-11]